MAEPTTEEIDRLIALSVKRGRSYALLDIDNGDERKRITVDADYPDTDECAAFDGRIVAQAYPDGSVDW